MKIFGTVPIGPGVAVSQVQIDGGTPVRITRQCGSENVFDDLFFETSGLRAVAHTLTITNLGNEADFQLDKIEWLPTDEPEAAYPLPAT